MDLSTNTNPQLEGTGTDDDPLSAAAATTTQLPDSAGDGDGNDGSPNRRRIKQLWTADGYPIVDGKYLDLSTGEVKPHTGPFRGGPPSVSVYWQNQLCTGRRDQFLVLAKAGAGGASCDLTEYLARAGGFFAKGLCKVHSLNATRYDVYVVVSSELSAEEFGEALGVHGLL
jgi:hypothetical protein